MNGKKVLVLGGTGAMGSYLVPELAAMGYQVDVVSLDNAQSDNPYINYIKADAKDDAWLQIQLKNNYDAIVDFMIYKSTEFSGRYETLLNNANHLIFLSSCRVYCGEPPTKEDGTRHLDTSKDKEFLSTAENEYSLYKALQEDILRNSKYCNWTIVRPSITYSRRRFQLVTLEAPVIIQRTLRKQPVFLPEAAMEVQATMTWGGDVAKMMSRLVLNPAVKKETYTLATAEHHTWGEIAEYYKKLIGLEYIVVGTEKYLEFFGSTAAARYQLIHSRCHDKFYDNSKILNATGLKQSDFILLKNGLARELSALPHDINWGKNEINERMDAYAEDCK